MSGTKINAWQPHLQTPRQATFCQKIIHKVFSPMHRGRLVMTLPDGGTVVYGRETGGLEADMQVRDSAFFKKCVLFGDIGFGESFVDGDWTTSDLTKVIEWMILNVEDNPVLMDDRVKRKPVNFLKIANRLLHCLRMNTLTGSRKNIADHYDLGNDFFSLFLDPTMTYSSGIYTSHTADLEKAQIQKYDELCHKLRIKASDHVLEIGSGWGGFAVHAARNFGCHVTTLTISRNQFDYVRGLIEREGLGGRIAVRLTDYRALTEERYDKIVSIEMIEAVGHEFLPVYFRQCHALLKKDGMLGLQMILCPDHRYDSFRHNVDWIQKYIFPGSLIPSMEAVQKAIRANGTLNLFDYKDITASYVRTLAAWRDNFNARGARIRELGFDETFVRKWNYYWSYCEAAFHMRNISVVQAIFSRPNNLRLQ